jgi:putative flippase GtrA
MITRQIFRFGMVGILSNIGGYFIYLLLTGYGIQPKMAMSFLYVVGALAGFFGNRLWSFQYQGAVLQNFMRYIVAHVLGYGLNFLMLSLFVDRLLFPHQLIQAIAILSVAGFLFIAFKFFVFPMSAKSTEVS